MELDESQLFYLVVHGLNVIYVWSMFYFQPVVLEITPFSTRCPFYPFSTSHRDGADSRRGRDTKCDKEEFGSIM